MDDAARRLGAKVSRGDCTSAFNRKIIESLQWRSYFEIYFKDYVDERGNVIIKTKPPHDKYSLHYKVFD